ncbi:MULTISPECIES: four helix bundle protein [Empedobacter]|uniref:Four helix bundle protein n=1 Tax=Empedobacter falsenii TaxID=343874 RepID=A0A376G1L4_9FLAO|nr:MULTISPECIES: four helix bundle protein [Empedobacter]MBW1619683.1 four helix bundle protein [Empedobacter falsenii]MBY0066470.1 four helix bundle protein [Empedobacter falsenii]MDH0660370.1 four helix bundle protein [Empedobacter sp. GD03865]MDH0675661.1 four helix bundle protein [Empedobacter sp. GD03861]MDH1603270.1 four helix bundle protein [Empedobacter sp. GD03739]
MHDFKELIVWQKTMNFTKRFYEITSNYPKSEIYGLTSQSRRACVSIASNIAEGAGRNSNAQFINFLNIALGSSFELECQIILARDLEFIQVEISDNLLKDLKHIQNMLVKLIQNYN